MLTPYIMLYIMIGVLVLYCIVFQYFYGKKICEDYKRMVELSGRNTNSRRIVPVVTGIIVENIPENSVIITLNDAV